MSKIQVLKKVGKRSSTGKSRWSQKSRTQHFGQLGTAEVFQLNVGVIQEAASLWLWSWIARSD